MRFCKFINNNNITRAKEQHKTFNYQTEQGQKSVRESLLIKSVSIYVECILIFTCDDIKRNKTKCP